MDAGLLPSRGGQGDDGDASDDEQIDAADVIAVADTAGDDE
jgi:hypothetical protein